MEILRPEVNFASLIDSVKTTGVAFAADVLLPEFREALCSEVDTIPLAEERLDKSFLKLQFESATLRYPISDYPLIGELGLALSWQARLNRGRLDSLANWYPNEVAIQRYRNDADDISAHRDYQRDRYLIAVVTAAGYGRFEVLSRDGSAVKRSFETGPGSLTLLWAPHLTDGDGDRRPLHRALAPRYGSRISVTYRLVAARAS